jgi:hypothetical protein
LLTTRLVLKPVLKSCYNTIKVNLSYKNDLISNTFDIPLIEIDGLTFGSSCSKNELSEFLVDTVGSKVGDFCFLQYDG